MMKTTMMIRSTPGTAEFISWFFLASLALLGLVATPGFCEEAESFWENGPWWTTGAPSPDQPAPASPPVTSMPSATTSLPTTASPVVPDNDECDNAMTLVVNGPVASGTTVDATFSAVPNGSCGGVRVVAPGRWYTVVGTGEFLTASLCDGIDTYDSKISVFQGTCNDLDCIGGNDDFCDLQSSYGWQSDTGTTYWILVHGFNDDSVGDYTIEVTGSIATAEPTSQPTEPEPTSQPTEQGDCIALGDDCDEGDACCGGSMCTYTFTQGFINFKSECGRELEPCVLLNGVEYCGGESDDCICE